MRLTAPVTEAVVPCHKPREDQVKPDRRVGKPGGKKLGFVMTQIIDQNGEYYKKTKELIKAGCVFDFVSLKEGNESKTVCEKAPQTRVRYKCECSSFWGKKGLKVRCLNCNENFICEV